MDDFSFPPLQRVRRHGSRCRCHGADLAPSPIDGVVSDAAVGPASEQLPSRAATDEVLSMKALGERLSVVEPATAQQKAPASALRTITHGRGRKQWVAAPKENTEPQFRPLLPEEGLVFRVMTGEVQNLDEACESAAQKFRGAFADVWRRIPAADRCRIRKYWSMTHDHSYGIRPGSPVPLIQLVQALNHRARLRS
jgi:hypothetical protein